MAKTEKNDWQAKADFMREANAQSATWAPSGELLDLKLYPKPPQLPQGPAQRMGNFHQKNVQTPAERAHEVLFAASSVRPKLTPVAAPTDVPRAVRAKEEAARRGGGQG